MNRNIPDAVHPNMSNKIKTITKLKSGALKVELQTGPSFEISKNDELFQVYTVWKMLNAE